MFFSICRTQKNNFPNIHQFKKFYIMLDNGWSSIKHNGKMLFYKGYVECEDINTFVKSDKLRALGNYCVITVGDKIQITTNLYRSFPLQYNENEVTNLYQLSNKNIWADTEVTLNDDLQITREYINDTKNCRLTSLTEEEVVENLYSILYSSTEQFLSHNKLPLKIFLTGGLDSLLVYSFIQKITSDYEIITYQYFDYDEFWCKNGQSIRQSNWSYKQLHHWKEPSVIASGTSGDGYMLRGIDTANLYLNYNGTNILTELNLHESHERYNLGNLSNDHLLEKENKQKVQLQEIKGLSQSGLVYYLCNMISNDWQHHHLGNTLTFTPLRNIELFKCFFQLPIDNAVSQIINGSITKKLISKNNPKLLQYISENKNSNNCMSTAWDLYRYIGII